ncbi:MAG TPA: tol-pal system protein YbgF [Vicinamibacterales bacterium]|nr:tol-pal system protein YbgF [Vicinamibacterales bacterium]
MNRISTSVVVGLLAMSLAPRPVYAQNREHQQMTADVRMLQEQTQLLAQSLAQLMTRLGELRDGVKGLETRLEAAEAASRKTAADQKLSLDSLSTDVRVVRERTQDVNTRIGTLTEEVEALRTSLPSIAAQAAAAAAAPQADGQTTAAFPTDAAATAPTPAQPRSGLSSNRLFQTAMADYTAGKYSLAISGFQNLLNDWPKSELADDALYYIGYSYAQEKKYSEAAKAFSDVIQTYPGGDKVPDAYVDLGAAQRALGQIDAARSTWQTVISKYPGSSSAIIAKQRLDGLSQPGTPLKP